ncbi:MAG: hypothetical protein IT462_05100 [Planctomycetes bacterium]|nr:hypothetical protein [Planctomycetota bacterium]
MNYRPTIPLGRWFGVEIRLDLMLVGLGVLLFFISLRDATAPGAAPGEVWSAFAHLALLGSMALCMFLHEIGHAVAAYLRGHRATMILLSFIGLTFFETKNAKPSDEVWIALAGPAVNIALAIVSAPAILVAAGQPQPMFSLNSIATPAGFFAAFSVLNFLVGMGNLMPVWPADGARAVRGWLARSRGFERGTQRAVEISHGLWLISAGIATFLMTTGSWLVGPQTRAASNSLSMVLMYQLVVMAMAWIGIYYGMAELKRVRKLGERQAAVVVGPPPEFMPARKHTAILDAEVVSGGRSEEEKMGSLDDAAKKAKAGAEAAKALWKVAKLSGKGAGWFVKQSWKLAGAMMKEDEKDKKK